MIKKYGLLLIILTGVVVWQSCTKAIIDNPSTEDLPPITREIKYNPDVANIMFSYCITCHGGTSPSAGLGLTSYEDVRHSLQNGNMWSKMNDVTDPMPPSGILNARDLQIIDKWRSDGYPQ